MKRGLLYLLALVTLASCAQDSISEVQIDGAVNKIYASIDDSDYADSDDGTRVELNDKKQTVWTEGDLIMTFYHKDISVYAFDGKTGDRNGSFTYSGYLSKNDYGLVYDQHYALYLADAVIAGFPDKTPAFYTTLPHTQYYKEHSYGLDTNAMLGTSSDGKNYKFKNLFSYIRLSITGDKVVKSIKISGNNNEVLAGQVYMDINGYLGMEPNAADISTTITLDCEDGVQLSDTPTEFYITMLPQTLTNGLSVSINFTDGTIFPRSTSKSIMFERNTIQPMANIDSGKEVTWQEVIIYHKGNKVAAPYFEGSSALTGYIYWGDEYMSDINRLFSYSYLDGKEEHTISTKTMNAQSISIDNCRGISNIDLSNF